MIRLSSEQATLMTLIVKSSREVVLRFYRPDSCIATTRVIVDVALEYGITVTPQPVSVCAFNAKAAPLFEAGVPLEYWPDDAHSVGVTGTGPPVAGAWNGHLIGLTDAFLVDGSLDQMSRPARDLTLPPLVARLPDGGWKTDMAARLRHGRDLLVYTRIVNDEYRDSPNWSRRAPDIRYVTALALKGVRNANKGH